jgi:hypothetical protein
LRVDKIAATIAARHRVTWPGQGAFQKYRSRLCMNTWVTGDPFAYELTDLKLAWKGERGGERDF